MLGSAFLFGCTPPNDPPPNDLPPSDPPPSYSTITIGDHVINKDSLINGYTIPLDGVGNNGEYYLDVNSKDVYLKENSKWSLIGNMDGKPLKRKWDRSNPLKILGIGNSFTEDPFTYLPNILESLGITNFRVSYLAIPGLDIQTNLNNIQNESAAYRFSDYVDGAWTHTAFDKTFYYGVNNDDWDYITLQQSSGYSGISSSYSPLQNIINEVEAIRPEAKIVWQMTWAYQQDLVDHPHFPFYNNEQLTMYNAIVDSTKEEILTNAHISFTVPNGTVVQNARTSWLGDTLTRDGYHMDEEIGRYLIGLTFAYTFTGYDITGLSFRPSGVSEEARDICIESVYNAVKHPFEITNSVYSFENYVELSDYGWTEFGYWNSNDPSGRHYKVISGDTISNNFICTKQFDRATLPVGSIIELSSGYSYKPDGWIGTAITEAARRPHDCTTTRVSRVIIDDAWWGNFSVRAFNVFKNGKPSLVDETDQAKAAFKIWIPKSL